MAAPWCQWRWGAPKWPPTPQTLGAPRRSRDAPRMAASWCQWQNGAPPWPRLDASAVSVKDARRAAPWSAAASDRRRGSTVRSARGTACASRRCSGAGATSSARASSRAFRWRARRRISGSGSRLETRAGRSVSRACGRIAASRGAAGSSSTSPPTPTCRARSAGFGAPMRPIAPPRRATEGGRRARAGGAILARRGAGPVLVRATGAVEEIAPGVLFVHAFANVTALRTDAGLVLVDTGNYRARDKTFAAVRGWDGAPLAAAVYTHGHVDHACGLPPFLEEARTRSWPRPRIVGHRDVARRFDRYRATAPWNGLINARQFSIAPWWPTAYDYPDTTYADTHRLEIGGVALELTHARGETDDHTWLWWPARRMLFTGDLFFWVAPNAGNPQKVQRYAAEWAAALRAMAARGAELLVPGHGVPVVGAGRVRPVLEDTAEWLETLARETVARMNAGASLEQILAEVRPPAHLADRPYLQPVYDEPEFVVRNVWRLYGGWWDGVPAHLKPAPEATLGREVAALAGGAGALVARATALAASGDLALASHLADWAVAAAPDDRAAHAARAALYA